MPAAIGLVAPIIAPLLGPIVSDVAQAVGGAVGQAGQGLSGLVGQLFKSFNPLQSLLGGGQNQGAAQSSPFPFNLGNLAQGIFNNPLGALFGGNKGGGNSGGGGVGAGLAASVGGGGQNWSDLAAKSAGASWGDLQNQMKAAQASGDPAQMAAAQQKIGQYTNFVEMMSQLQKTMHDAEQAIIRNIA
jgi:type III secretion apparatus needle protein